MLCLMMSALCAVTAAYPSDELASMQQEPSCSQTHRQRIFLFGADFDVWRCMRKLLVLQLIYTFSFLHCSYTMSETEIANYAL